MTSHRASRCSPLTLLEAHRSSCDLRFPTEAYSTCSCLAPPPVSDPNPDPNPDLTDTALVPWGGVAMAVSMFGMWVVMHACCFLCVPLVLTAPMVMLVVLLASLAQYCSDRAYACAQSAMLHMCCTRSKHAPYLLALLTLSACFL